MATLTTLQKADVLDQDGDNLFTSTHSVISSDPAVARMEQGNGYSWMVAGQTVGEATITATRLADGATASLEVEVVPGTPFAITLAVPR